MILPPVQASAGSAAPVPAQAQVMAIQPRRERARRRSADAGSSGAKRVEFDALEQIKSGLPGFFLAEVRPCQSAAIPCPAQASAS